MKFVFSYVSLFYLFLSIGCSSARQTATPACSSVTSIIKTASMNSIELSEGSSGLLITTHLDHSDDNLLQPLSSNEVLRQCNTSIELLQEKPPKIRLWTASHCVRPLLLKSMKLAIREKSSSSGGYYLWDLRHKVLEDGITMRRVYESISSREQVADRQHLISAFDRRNMQIEGTTAVLNPRVSCENLRWSQDADLRHSLCFSIFDLIYFDVDLPEPDSDKSKALIASLLNSEKVAAAENRLYQLRETFLRRMNTTSQVNWIINESERLKDELGTTEFSQILSDAGDNAQLNWDVFSLPQQEESGFMPLMTVTGQDAVPPAQNRIDFLKNQGNYSSPRGTINGVTVGCYRQLRKYNPTTELVETIPELEMRPYKFCAGGESPQPDHFWIRNREWSWMMADLTLAAAQQYSKSIYDLALETSDPSGRLSRFKIVSSFGVSEELGFENILADLKTPLLRHLRMPISYVTDSIFGFDKIEETGAFLFSLPTNQTQARFLKGDSGSIVMLDGVPFATLYSVDGEETSGGVSILSLPELTEIEDDDGTEGSGRSARAVTRGKVGESSTPVSSDKSKSAVSSPCK